MVLSNHEVEASGEGIADVLKTLYARVKPVLGPAIKTGLKTIGKLGLSALEDTLPEFQPEIYSLGNRYLDKGIDKLGKITGAYGVGKGCGSLLPSDHPALKTKARKKRKGGSFLLA